MTTVKPLWPWYLLKPDAVVPQAGGIYLPSITSFGETATVVAVPDVAPERPLNVGDVVIYDRQNARGAGADNKDLQLVKIDDIRAVLKKDQVALPEGEN